jgi:hypothetical protein
VGRLGPRDNRTIDERMCGRDDPVVQQRGECRRGLTVHQALDIESPPPVLLALTAHFFAPAPLFHLVCEAEGDQSQRCPESPPVRGGPQRMHCAAFRAAPSFDPHGLDELIEVTRHVSVSPKTETAASGAARRTRPGIAFSQANQSGHIDRQREYQVATPVV